MIEFVKTLKDNYSWLYINKNKEAYCFDCADGKAVYETIKTKNYKLKLIFITHHHEDHINGVKELKELSGAKSVAYIKDKDKIIADKYLDLGKHKLEENKHIIIKKLSGHTINHVVYIIKEDNILIAGDTIFKMGVGKNFEASTEVMYNDIISLIKDLKKETKIYSGHEYTLKNIDFAKSLGINSDIEVLDNYETEQILKLNTEGTTYPSTLKEELEYNPFFKINNTIYLKELSSKKGIEFKSAKEGFSYLRKLRSLF